MSLSKGSVSITCFNVSDTPREPNFETVAFKEIPPESELRSAAGFLPLQGVAGAYNLGGLWGFRVRIETKRPDPGRVKALVESKVRAERDAWGHVSTQKRRAFRDEAEEELLRETQGSLKDVECVLKPKERLLIADTTSQDALSIVVRLLKTIGISATLKTPWGDRGEMELPNKLSLPLNPGEATNGNHFLKQLWPGDKTSVGFELEGGSVRLKTAEMALSVSGDVRQEVVAALEREDQREEEHVEILAARLWCHPSVQNRGEVLNLRLKGSSFQISGLKLPDTKKMDWIEELELRLEWIEAVYDVLFAAYAAHLPGSADEDSPPTSPHRDHGRTAPLVGAVPPAGEILVPARASPSAAPPPGGEAA